MKSENIFITLFVIFAILFFAIGIARADKYHHGVIIEQSPTETLPTNAVLLSTKGIASAIATSQHQFYWGTKSWQGSVGIGAFDSNTAFSFGMAKRFNKTLINGSISNEDGKIGGGIGVNWLF